MDGDKPAFFDSQLITVYLTKSGYVFLEIKGVLIHYIHFKIAKIRLDLKKAMPKQGLTEDGRDVGWSMKDRSPQFLHKKADTYRVSCLRESGVKVNKLKKLIGEDVKKRTSGLKNRQN